MKHKLMKLIAPAALLGVTALPALNSTQAQAATSTWKHNINVRQVHQQAHIRQGERSGALTYREANRLEQREGHIRTVEARDRRSGGRFTLAERHQVQRDLNHTSRAVYHQKHDRQYR